MNSSKITVPMQQTIEAAVTQLEKWIESDDNLAHLRVKKRGTAVTLYSEPEYGPMDHARFNLLDASSWNLMFPHHSGRWERTPFVGSLDEMLNTLTGMLSFHLSPR